MPAMTVGEFELLARVIAPTMTPVFAKEVLRWRFPEDDLRRMQKLAEKAREGILSDAERIEARAFARVGSLIGIVTSIARRSIDST